MSGIDILPIGSCATCQAEQGCNEPFRSEWCHSRRERAKNCNPITVPSPERPFGGCDGCDNYFPEWTNLRPATCCDKCVRNPDAKLTDNYRKEP